MKKILALSLTLLALTPAAAVAGTPSPVVGQTLCDAATQRCITVGPSDCIMQLNPDVWQVTQFLGIAGIPCPKVGAPGNLNWSAIAAVNPIGATVPVIGVPVTLASYCNAYTDYGAKTAATGDLPAKVGTPPALFAACNADPSIPHFSRYANEPVADPEPAPPTTKPAVAAPVSTKDVGCAAVALGKSKVAVRAMNLKCTTARNMLAAYLRRGVEPKGYICVRAKAGKVRSASCGKPGRASTRVTGRWRG